MILKIFIFILKVYLIFLMIILLIYAIRHIFFTLNRSIGSQRIAYHDIMDSDLPKVTILVPMHNEEKVINNILSSLINVDYPKDKLEIIPINDHSTDKTKEILDSYALRYSFIKPYYRYEGPRGKQNGINESVDIAQGDIIIIYDADYIVPKGQIKDMIKAFIDPEVGAVMGRVIPYNFNKNLLTMMLDLERSAGYQVDQQARYNLDLIPQYGGTTAAFRKDLFIKLGKFDPNVLAEDTELTFKLYLNGYKVVYTNRLEALEEVPENYIVRAKQIRRWSRGHNQVMFKYLIPLIKSNRIKLITKVDGILLLLIYTIPFLTLVGYLDSLILFFLGEMSIVNNYLFLLAVYGYNTFGNFAPFYQVGTAAFLDGRIQSIRILPLFITVFLFNIYYTSLGFIDAIIDLITKRTVKWEKTQRFFDKSLNINNENNSEMKKI
jgi:cellulose synthase/poly-beta-1,6-N-acetylglucosamine synthase-like glycosyltransferase